MISFAFPDSAGQRIETGMQDAGRAQELSDYDHKACSL